MNQASPATSSVQVEKNISVANKKSFNFILRIGVLAAVLLGVVFVTFTNSLSTRGFELEALKNRRIELKKDYEKIEIATTIPSSLYALRSSEIVQAMADVKSQKYLNVLADQVAVK